MGVSTIGPRVMLTVVDTPDLDPVADEVADRLAGAIETVPSATRVEARTAGD